MKLSVAVYVVAMVLLPSEGSEEVDEHHIIMQGPKGEVVYDDTQFFYIDDDHGVPQKAYAVGPNVSLAPIPPLMLRSQVRFHLYTRDESGSEVEDRLYLGENHNLKSSRFDPSLPVKVLIHGFGNTIESKTIQNPMKAYLETGDYNVIGVDWGDNAVLPFYLTAKQNTIQIGAYIAEMMGYLIQQAGVPPENIHLIGHSLGAHVSGIVGYNMGAMRLGRITGLDPAGPFYSGTLPEDMLDPSDGEFVDVIHTCGGNGWTDLGVVEPAGTVDFYPNGGANVQPGCENEGFLYRPACSHSKAHKLWTESIRTPHEFPAHRCYTGQEAAYRLCHGPVDGFMGEAANPEMHGIYGLITK